MKKLLVVAIVLAFSLVVIGTALAEMKPCAPAKPIVLVKQRIPVDKHWKPSTCEKPVTITVKQGARITTVIPFSQDKCKGIFPLGCGPCAPVACWECKWMCGVEKKGDYFRVIKEEWTPVAKPMPIPICYY